MYFSVNIVMLLSVLVESVLGSYGCVVVISGFYFDLICLNFLCCFLGVLFVVVSCCGVFIFVFLDFGDNFFVLDEIGEFVGVVLVEGIM